MAKIPTYQYQVVECSGRYPWRLWFAWYPVPVQGRRVWLRLIERRKAAVVHDAIGLLDVEFEYRRRRIRAARQARQRLGLRRRRSAAKLQAGE